MVNHGNMKHRDIGTALVTGADGFIGSHLTNELLSQGIRVRALCQYNSFGSRGWLEGVSSDNLEIVMGDVRDPELCRRICRGIDTVFHLAALIAIPYSYEAPHSYVDTNVSGTLNICQAALDSGVSRVVITSTSEVYGTALQVPIPETHPRQPQSPYSASKIGADAMALSYWHSFGLPVVVARPFNTYGPRQSARAFIPTIITQIAAGMRDIHVGDLTPTRDFNYVADTCRGFIALARTSGIEGQDFNICTGRDISMAQTLDIIAGIMDADVNIVVDPERLRPAGSEVRRLCGDNAKITAVTDWRPIVPVEEGLRHTVGWFTSDGHMSRYKADIYNK